MKQIEAYKAKRLSGLTPTECSKLLGLKTYYLHEKKLRLMLGEERFAEIQTLHSKRSELAKDSITYNNKTPIFLSKTLSRIELGALAEDLVFYKMRRFDLEAYRPLHPSRYDFIVDANGLAVKIQVKSTNRPKPAVKLVRNSYEKGPKARHYAKGEVDFFIMVDLQVENVFVVPADLVASRFAVSLRPGSEIWCYKDRYDLITTLNLRAGSSVGRAMDS